MVRLPLVSCLLPVLAACQGAPSMSLRGAAAGGNPAQNASHPQEAGVAGQVEELLNGTFQLSAQVAARRGKSKGKVCSASKKVNQCLMYRAEQANRTWNAEWTQYDNQEDEDHNQQQKRRITSTTTSTPHSSSSRSSRSSSSRSSNNNNIRTDSSGFVRWAVEGCVKKGLGKKVMKEVLPSPKRRSKTQARTRASNFYDAFGSSKLWCQVSDFRKVDRGDVLVFVPKIKGQKNKKGKDSEHFDDDGVVIAFRKPIPQGEDRNGRLVFVLKIIDSSPQPHFDFNGDKDTRSKCPKTSKKCGAGVGYVYVFTDKHGKILAIRIRGSPKDRNARNCTTKSGKHIACFQGENNKNHRYRVGRLLR